MGKNALNKLKKVFLKAFLINFFQRKKIFKIGIYGPPNVGKTSIANRISIDWLGEEIGSASRIPHETREVQMKEKIEIQSEDKSKKLTINLLDTPGIATKIDFEEFKKYGLKEEESKERAKQATQGVISAIKWLDKMDVVLAVMDSSQDPYTQVNVTILGNLEARDIPVLIVANKSDLKKANIKRIQTAFPQYSVVGLSAKKDKSIQELYNAIFKLVRK